MIFGCALIHDFIALGQSRSCREATTICLSSSILSCCRSRRVESSRRRPARTLLPNRRKSFRAVMASPSKLAKPRVQQIRCANCGQRQSGEPGGKRENSFTSLLRSLFCVSRIRLPTLARLFCDMSTSVARLNSSPQFEQTVQFSITVYSRHG